VFGLLLALFLLTVNYFSQYPETTDFYKFYKSAIFFSEGKSIYTPVPFSPPDNYLNKLSAKARGTIKSFHPNLNAPFHTLFLVPLGILPFCTSFWIWSVLSFSLVLTGVALIVTTRTFSNYRIPQYTIKDQGFSNFDSALKINSNYASGLISIFKDKNLLDKYAVTIISLWIITLFYYPSWINIKMGQYGFFLLGLTVFLWLSARNGKCVTSGIILGFAMSMKIFMGLFLIFFFAQRRWKVLFWALSVFFVLNILSLLILGLPSYHQHLQLITQSHLYINASWNASFLAFFTRIFGGAENIPLFFMPIAAYALSYGLSLILTLGLSWISWPRLKEPSPFVRFDIGFSLTVVAMLLISPFGWMYYFPVLLIPFLVAWNAALIADNTIFYRFLILFAWFLSSAPTTLINSEEVSMNQPIVWFTTSGYYFYALLIFSVTLISLSYKLNNHERLSL
jgi:hypothetical protein